MFRTQQRLLKRVSELAVFQSKTVSLPRLPVKSDIESAVPEFELKHLRAFHARKSLFAFVLLQEFRTDGRHFHGVVLRRFGPYLESKVVRYGVILCSLLKFGENKVEQLVNLQQFYGAMSETLSRKSYAEIAYGCFLVCLYNLRIDAPLPELLEHAHAFRLSTAHLQGSSTLSVEESLLLWCMWEKIMWNIGRKYLFHNANGTAEHVEKFIALTEEFLDENLNWRHWMHDSYVEVKLKMSFIRFVIGLDQSGTPESQMIKLSISKRFVKSWKRASGRGVLSTTDKLILRKLSRTLWSNLIALLEQIVHTGVALHEDFLGAIGSILAVVGERPDTEHSATTSSQLDIFLDTTLYVLVLVGLVLCELQRNLPKRGHDAEFALLASLFDVTRHRLCSTLSQAGQLEDCRILRSFDEASLDCYLQLDGATALSEWIRICG